MPVRKKGNTLERWEVALVKAMLQKGDQGNDQDILAYFTRPTRSINHRAIAEIRTGNRHRQLRPSTEEQLSSFLKSWPDLCPETGLNIRGDELLIKSREAMIAAVSNFNSAGLSFRSELFIVTAVIAWTYLFHSWFKREGIDYRYRQNGDVQKTKEGADRYWELSHCLRNGHLPVSIGARKNLELLLDIRHEIEHRSTNRIDDALGAKLQACCLNFNSFIIKEFGDRFSLEHRLPLALQFVTFGSEQRKVLKGASNLPANLDTLMDAFHRNLTDDEASDPAFSYRIAFVPKVGTKATKADVAVEFVKPGTHAATEISRILLKEVDKPRHTAKVVITRMVAEGYVKFNQNAHTQLWQNLKARTAGKGFGRDGDYPGTWVWYDSWIERVRTHCEENKEKYGFKAKGI